MKSQEWLTRPFYGGSRRACAPYAGPFYEESRTTLVPEGVPLTPGLSMKHEEWRMPRAPYAGPFYAGCERLLSELLYAGSGRRASTPDLSMKVPGELAPLTPDLSMKVVNGCFRSSSTQVPDDMPLRETFLWRFEESLRPWRRTFLWRVKGLVGWLWPTTRQEETEVFEIWKFTVPMSGFWRHPTRRITCILTNLRESCSSCICCNCWLQCWQKMVSQSHAIKGVVYQRAWTIRKGEVCELFGKSQRAPNKP